MGTTDDNSAPAGAQERQERARQAVAKLPPLEITQEELDSLPEYSGSTPTGTRPGKRWRRNEGSSNGAAGEPDPVWCVGEYGEPYPDPRGERFGKLVPITWYRPVLPDEALVPHPQPDRAALVEAAKELCEIVEGLVEDGIGRGLIDSFTTQPLRLALSAPAEPTERPAQGEAEP